MTKSAATEPIPPLYKKWTAGLLGGSIPRESCATCDACAMCNEVGHDIPSNSYFFDPAVKCCTYVPDLHNFLVGRILADTDSALELGRDTVEKRIAGGVGVTPLGLMQPPVFSLLYRSSEGSFGRSRTLRCPHFIEEGGRCGVWRNRNSVCSTWFCKHVRGEVGHTFWQSLHGLLAFVERDLSRWCILELQLGDDALRRVVKTAAWKGEAEEVTGASLDNKVDKKDYGRIWGKWHGRERAFFSRCAELVGVLSWKDVLAICGPEVRAHERLTQDSYRCLISDDIPSSLKVGSFQLAHMNQGITRVSTYLSSDPLDVPNTLMEVLHYFDGRPTESAIAAIENECGVRLDRALVRKMVDFMLLVPVADHTADNKSGAEVS